MIPLREETSGLDKGNIMLRASLRNEPNLLPVQLQFPSGVSRTKYQSLQSTSQVQPSKTHVLQFVRETLHLRAAFRFWKPFEKKR